MTGIEQIGAPPASYRFLRVWRGGPGDEWKIAVSQRTAIVGRSAGTSLRADRSVVGPLRSSNPPCHGARGGLDADIQRDESLAQRNRNAYAGLTAPEFLHIDRAGRAVQREEFLSDLFSSTPPISKIARGRQFKACDLMVLFLRREEDSDVGGDDLTELEVRVLANVVVSGGRSRRGGRQSERLVDASAGLASC